MNATRGKQDVTLVERAPAITQKQGTGQVTWPNGGANGSVAGLVTIGRWNIGPEKTQARTVRVTTFPIQPPTPPASFSAPPMPGAMCLITYEGQNGVALKRWVPVPCDLQITACQVQVQACAVGLPYQAFPQNCQPNADATKSYSIAVTFAEELGEVWPSIALYPATAAGGGGGTTGASLGGGAALGVQPLIYLNGGTLNGSYAGFLRSLEVVNESASTAYICVVDAPPVLTGNLSAAELLAWGSTIPIAVPAGQTVLRAFDDLPFFWSPWVGAVNGLNPGSAALVDGTLIFVEADYATIVAPGY